MTDYQKTVIYRIVCTDLAVKECYVGHTTNFTKRKSLHKHNCNTPLNANGTGNRDYSVRLYEFIRAHSGWDNFSMIEIEKYPCADNNEARTRERYWIETFSAELNMVRPIVTTDDIRESKAQNYQKNKECILEKQKLYYQQNKDSISEKKKVYQQKNKNKFSELKKRISTAK